MIGDEMKKRRKPYSYNGLSVLRQLSQLQNNWKTYTVCIQSIGITHFL